MSYLFRNAALRCFLTVSQQHIKIRVKVLQKHLEHKCCSNAFGGSKYFSSDSRPTLPIENKELLIPVPYGHLTAKAWGREIGMPVLAFHGWLDNCGTFNRLFPMLSDSLHIVAVDAPGHGLSSHKPPGCFYSYFDMIIDFKRVVDYLGWTKFHIIGHSMGGALAQLFACLFPSLVEKLVILDIAKPSSRFPEELPKLASDSIEKNLLIEQKLSNKPPVYSVDSAAERLKRGMHDEITIESAHVLLERGTRLSDCGNGVIFTRDLRMRTIEDFHKFSHEGLKAYMSQITCEMLLIMANNTHPMYKSRSPKILPEFFEIYKNHCKYFRKEIVEGNHFVHLNNPERIAPLINSFLCGST